MIMGMFASNGMFGVYATKELLRNKLAMFLYMWAPSYIQTCRFGPKNWAQSWLKMKQKNMFMYTIFHETILHELNPFVRLGDGPSCTTWPPPCWPSYSASSWSSPSIRASLARKRCGLDKVILRYKKTNCGQPEIDSRLGRPPPPRREM